MELFFHTPVLELKNYRKKNTCSVCIYIYIYIFPSLDLLSAWLFRALFGVLKTFDAFLSLISVIPGHSSQYVWLILLIFLKHQ